jgi:hypothetical protein
MKTVVPTWCVPYFRVERLAEVDGKDDINALETRCASRSKDRLVAIKCCVHSSEASATKLISKTFGAYDKRAHRD